MATFEQLPGELNLALVQGDEFFFTAQLNLDLTGYTVESAVVHGTTGAVLAEPDVSVDHTTEDGVTTSAVGWLLSEEQTASLKASAMRWHLRIISPGGVTRTLLAGSVRVVRE